MEYIVGIEKAFKEYIGLDSIKKLRENITEKPMILIAGDQLTGKSTQAKNLAEHYRGTFYSVGNLFREVADKRGITVAEQAKLLLTERGIDVEIDYKTCEMISGKNNVSYNLYKRGNIEGFNVETYLVLYAIYYEELIRKDKVRRNIDLMPSKLIECNEIADFKINFNIKKNRIWIHEYIKSLSLEQIDVQLILCLDAARGAYKICEENNNDTGFISEYLKVNNK